jgi:NAD(P)-dependent dehydrogenase (short-subunit alcohol dehydrogenase family)
MSKVWLITGSATGLGRNIAERVLASGDRLVATARDPGRLEDLVEKYSDQVRTAPLDVADEAAAYAAMQVAIDMFGRLDVVVNNAGSRALPRDEIEKLVQATLGTYPRDNYEAG